MGCPNNLINIIWHCVSSSTISILWNDEALDDFKTSQGIRQGDSISSYLFVLCFEKLTQLIQSKVQDKQWKLTHLSQDAFPLSHLTFASNLILFSEVSSYQAKSIKLWLNIFCTSSRLKVSESKFRVFFLEMFLIMSNRRLVLL